MLAPLQKQQQDEVNTQNTVSQHLECDDDIGERPDRRDRSHTRRSAGSAVCPLANAATGRSIWAVVFHAVLLSSGSWSGTR